ncbi:MAG: 16S rRNA processing protein RimM [Clostridiales bacterium]|nr:16S rRNA processing protein RimM [Clostridiales bacterium]
MDQYLLVGSVLKPQGIRGELKLAAFADDQLSYKSLKKVYIKDKDGSYIQYDLRSVRESGSFVFMSFEGVNDMNEAERFRGKDVYVLRDDVDELPEGVYYLVDVIGCEVKDNEDNYIGKVQDILQYPSGDIYVVKGKKEIMFPSVPDVFVDIDVENGIVIVDKKRFGEVAVVED